jgi:hypothetical protein
MGVGDTKDELADDCEFLLPDPAVSLDDAELGSGACSPDKDLSGGPAELSRRLEELRSSGTLSSASPLLQASAMEAGEELQRVEFDLSIREAPAIMAASRTTPIALLQPQFDPPLRSMAGELVKVDPPDSKPFTREEYIKSQFVEDAEVEACGTSKANMASQSVSDNDAHESHASRVTTLMLRNVPNRYTQKELILELEALGFSRSTFDFFYLPFNKATQSNVGYAFVNFLEPAMAQKCMAAFKGHRFQRYSRVSGKVAIARLQGIDEILKQYDNTAVCASWNKEHGPLIATSSISPPEEAL